MFREYDIRGRVDDDLTPEAAETIGRAYGTFLRRRSVAEAVIGYDAREYSPRMRDAFLRGLVTTGVSAVDVGMVISPILYFAQYHYHFKGGVMITASHNPNGWGGFKLGHDYATTLLPDDIQEMYRIIEKEEYVSGNGGVEERSGIIDAYREFVISRISLKRRLTVVVNAGNCTAGPIVPPILRALGCTVIEQYCDIDTRFPNHEPNPTLPEAAEALGEKVREVGADVGFGYDGDGDRLGVVDERGLVVWPDQVLILLARLVLKDAPGASIVFDVKCSQALPEDIIAHGGVPVMWKTGHSYIKQKSKEVDAALGGERSGHIFFRHGYYSYDDAVFASLKLLEDLSGLSEPFSRALADVPQYVSSPTWQVDCADNVKYAVVDRLIAEFKAEYGASRVIDINGARVSFPDGWGLVRASSNLPVLTLGFEGKTREAMDRIMEIFKKKLAAYPEIGREWKNG